MSEATIHTLPSETTITEDLSRLGDDTKRFFARNRNTAIVVLAIGTAILINRSILRRELRRLNFSVDVFPYDMGDLGEEFADVMDRT